MRFIEWNDNFITGVHECDIQHKKIINVFNAIYDAIRLNINKRALKDSFNSLINYFDKHFTLEENLMEKYGYPELQEHREEHKKLRETIDKFMQKPEEEINYLEVLKYLKNWWVNHIITMDKKYGLFLESKIK